MAENRLKKSRWDRLNWLYQVSLCIAVGLGILTFAKERVAAVFSSSGMSDFPVPHLSVALLLVTLILMLRWVRASASEMRMLRDHFEEFIPILPKHAFCAAILLAVSLGTLGYFSNRIVVYAAIFATYNLFDMWGTWLVIAKVREALRNARQEAPRTNGRQDAWNAIENYYLNKPLIARCATIQFLAFVSLALGMQAQLQVPDHIERLLRSIAFGLMIIIIASSSLVIYFWRKKRDLSIGETYM